IAATRKSRAAELLHSAEMAEHGIADVGGCGGKVGFIHGAMQQRSRRHENLLRLCIQPDSEHEQREHRTNENATHRLTSPWIVRIRTMSVGPRLANLHVCRFKYWGPGPGKGRTD